MCVGLFINASYGSLSGMFQGVGKTKLSMVASTLELGSRVLWALILRNFIAEAGVWWNEPPAFLAACLFLYACYFFSRWDRTGGEAPRSSQNG